MSINEASDIVLITGSRSIRDKEWIYLKLDRLARRPTSLIHGGAIGVDSIAGQWAKDRDIPVRVVRPNFKKWPVDRYRWKAYTERDYAMVREADFVVALWDGHSSGTKLTFEYADRCKKLHSVERYIAEKPNFHTLLPTKKTLESMWNKLKKE